MGGCAVGCLLVLAQPLILLWEWLASVKIGYDRIFGGRQAVPKETIMSWSTAKVGKAECVRPALAEEFVLATVQGTRCGLSAIQTASMKPAIKHQSPPDKSEGHLVAATGLEPMT